MKSLDKDGRKIRLQVFLSRNGVCSRREAMDVIQRGHVCVNSQKITEPSFAVDPYKDKVLVENKLIKPKSFDYLILHKPKGYVTTKSDKFAKKTVYDLLPNNCLHLSPVGRLDKETEGLLFLTNNGDVAHRMTHPRYGVDKTYYVCVKGILEKPDRMRVERGLYIGGRRTAPAVITNIQPKRQETTLTITIHEGRKRQIRIMFSKVGHKVMYLKRTVQGPLKLGNLRAGQYRALTKKEVQAILDV